ncbi:MAG: isoprenylcysteine carboxylmethyltransferase family protein [Chloroflexi bacterium]|nr:isoprenylcysteine carboxylmethyltransferase family protein [Chloroflexota bacterium]
MDLEFRILCALIASAIVLVRVYFFFQTKDFEGTRTKVEGDVIGFLRRVFLGLGVFVSLGYILGFPWLDRFGLEFNNAIKWAGVLIMALSPVLLAWVHLSLGKNFSRTLKVKSRHELVTIGPYSRIRHPMYSAFTLMHLGLFLLSGNYIIGFVGLAYMTVIIVRISKEEKMLLDYFQEDYTKYIARTGRLLPKLRKPK